MERSARRQMVVVACALVVGLCAAGQGKVIYVDDDATEVGDGSSWIDAFQDLQDALAMAMDGDEIRVAQGIYTPDRGAGLTPGDREATFHLISGVTLAGGYAGLGVADPDERDIDRYETILSGDLDGDDGPDFAGLGDNSRIVVSSLGNDAATVLEGFTITGGWGVGGSGITCLESNLLIADCTIARNKTKGTRTSGAGMSSVDGSPVLRNCVFKENLAWGHGGGFWSSNGRPVFVECLFEGNRSEQDGGGLYVSSGAVTLERCTFRGNQAFSGGGMGVRSGDESVGVDCLFIDNTARIAGAGVGSGGGVYVAGVSPMTFRGCRFEANSAEEGGGLANNCGAVTMIDCTFHQNWAGKQGGGVVNRSWFRRDGGALIREGDLILTRCVFTQNVAAQGGALDNTHSAPTLTDCTFEDNMAQRINRSGWGGGAIYTVGGISLRGGGAPTEVAPVLVNCRFIGNRAVGSSGGGLYNNNNNTMLVNCLFVGNVASEAVRSHSEGVGGGLYTEGASPTLIHCTLAQNRGGAGGGLSDETGGTVLDHCIVWGNNDNGISGSVLAVYSDIEGGWPGEGNIDVDPCFAAPGFWDPNETADDPSDDVWVDGDYHLKSQAGRWDSSSESWVQDEVTSPCIDAGDPNAPIGDEPFPNGGIINVGAYAGMAEASKTYWGEPLCEMNMAGDINGDCRVDIKDLLTVLSQWWPAGPVVEQGPHITFLEPTDGAILEVVSGPFSEPLVISAEIGDPETIVNVVFHISHTENTFSYHGQCEGQQWQNRWSGQWYWTGDPARLLSGEHVIVVSVGEANAEQAPVSWGWSLGSYTLPDGEYVITAEVTEDRGRTTVSPEVKVTIVQTARSRGR